jgi:hypothetical protein
MAARPEASTPAWALWRPLSLDDGLVGWLRGGMWCVMTAVLSSAFAVALLGVLLAELISGGGAVRTEVEGWVALFLVPLAVTLWVGFFYRRWLRRFLRRVVASEDGRLGVLDYGSGRFDDAGLRAVRVYRRRHTRTGDQRLSAYTRQVASGGVGRLLTRSPRPREPRLGRVRTGSTRRRTPSRPGRPGRKPSDDDDPVSREAAA